MTSPATRVDGWELGQLVETHEAELADRFPRSVVWFGRATRHWWAYTRDADGAVRLLEADSPYNLASMLDTSGAGAVERIQRLRDFIDTTRPVERTPERSRSRGRKHSHHGRHVRS